MNCKITFSKEEWIDHSSKDAIKKIESDAVLASYVDTFVNALKHLDLILSAQPWLEFNNDLKGHLNNCQALLPADLHLQFADAVYSLIATYHQWRMPRPLELELIHMHLSANHSLRKKIMLNRSDASLSRKKIGSTWKVHALVRYYKEIVGGLERLNATEYRKTYGQRPYEDYLKVTTGTPTIEQVKEAINLLSDCTPARFHAEGVLKKLEATIFQKRESVKSNR